MPLAFYFNYVFFVYIVKQKQTKNRGFKKNFFDSQNFQKSIFVRAKYLKI